MNTVVDFDHVSKTFPGSRHVEQVNALDDVDISVAKGSIIGIIGYSGAGKSTLVRLINGLEKPSDGTVSVLGVDVGAASEAALRHLRSRIGMIFQQFNLFNSRTVRGNVAYPLKVAGWKREDINRRVDELLDFVGIKDKAKQYPRRLSGGQKQRVGIARAIATNPEILLADEATSALDPQTTREVLDLLREVNDRLGITIVVITHQISIVHALCDQVVVMEGGKVVDSGDTYRVFTEPKAELTRRFVTSVTQGEPGTAALTALRAGGGELISVDLNEFSTDDAARIFANHCAEGVVVYGGVTDVQGRSLGAVTYRVTAQENSVDAILAELQQRTTARILTEGAPA